MILLTTFQTKNRINFYLQYQNWIYLKIEAMQNFTFRCKYDISLPYCGIIKQQIQVLQIFAKEKTGQRIVFCAALVKDITCAKTLLYLIYFDNVPQKCNSSLEKTTIKVESKLHLAISKYQNMKFVNCIGYTCTQNTIA